MRALPLRCVALLCLAPAASLRMVPGLGRPRYPKRGAMKERGRRRKKENKQNEKKKERVKNQRAGRDNDMVQLNCLEHEGHIILGLTRGNNPLKYSTGTTGGKLQAQKINVAGIWELGSGTRVWDSEKKVQGLALWMDATP